MSVIRIKAEEEQRIFDEEVAKIESWWATPRQKDIRRQVIEFQ